MEPSSLWGVEAAVEIGGVEIELSNGEADAVEVVGFACGRVLVVGRDTLAHSVVTFSDEEVISVHLSSSSITMIGVEELDIVDTMVVVLSVGGVCGEYIIFKSSIVGFAFNVVVRLFTQVSVRGDGERETNR